MCICHPGRLTLSSLRCGPSQFLRHAVVPTWCICRPQEAMVSVEIRRCLYQLTRGGLNPDELANIDWVE